ELHPRDAAERLRHGLRRPCAAAQRRSRRTRRGTGLARRRSQEPARRPDPRRHLPVPASGPLDRPDRARPPLTSRQETPMKKLAILALIAACGGKYQAPPPLASIPLLDGSQLKPYTPPE